MSEKPQIRIQSAMPPLAVRLTRPLSLLRRELIAIVAVVGLFVALRFHFGRDADVLLHLVPIGFALVLGVAVLAAAYRPRGSR